jgi:predicted nuclease of predicted toxin-antitoxin system
VAKGAEPARLRLLLDEMYSPAIARLLRELGHDAISVKDRADLAGTTDADLLSLMSAEDRAIVTNNAVDFVPLLVRLAGDEQDHAGVLLTSDRSLPRSRAPIGRFVELLDRLLRQQSAPDSLRNQVRWLP